MRRAWIAVACAEHVRRGVELGFMQVCHGKPGPLRRLRAGDWVAYYSPTEQFRGDLLQCFTALGEVSGDRIEQVESGGFRPFRRSVRWLASVPVPIRPLREVPGFALGGPGWGAKLRFGLLEVDWLTLNAVATAMGVPTEECQSSVSSPVITA